MLPRNQFWNDSLLIPRFGAGVASPAGASPGIPSLTIGRTLTKSLESVHIFVAVGVLLSAVMAEPNFAFRSRRKLFRKFPHVPSPPMDSSAAIRSNRPNRTAIQKFAAQGLGVRRRRSLFAAQTASA
ncbi:MAG: hypothetical protein ACM3SP_01780 [Chloroflexota bacterium]